MLTEYNIKRHYDSKHADGVYGKLKGRNQELKVDLFKRATRTMLCLLLFGPQLKKFAHPCPITLRKGGHGESNNAKTKKKTVCNCDITNIKIKSLLYSLEYIEA